MGKENKAEGFDPEATKEVLHHLERIYDEQERTFWQIQQKVWVILGAFSAVLIAVISTQSIKILEKSHCLYVFYVYLYCTLVAHTSLLECTSF